MIAFTLLLWAFLTTNFSVAQPIEPLVEETGLTTTGEVSEASPPEGDDALAPAANLFLPFLGGWFLAQPDPIGRIFNAASYLLTGRPFGGRQF